MKYKYVKHKDTGKIYEILERRSSGYAVLKDIETGEQLEDQDIHCANDPFNQKDKDYIYVEDPKKSEYYSVF